MVIWITGLPGSGKTTITCELQLQLRNHNINPVILDGDALREVFANRAYDASSREKLALTYAKMANLLSNQGHTVIVATVSLFHSVHQWNRANNTEYLEVFIKPCLDTLHYRDQKGLYSNKCDSLGERVGKQVLPEYPQSPDFAISNNTEQDLHYNIQTLLHEILIRLDDAPVKI